MEIYSEESYWKQEQRVAFKSSNSCKPIFGVLPWGWGWNREQEVCIAKHAWSAHHCCLCTSMDSKVVKQAVKTVRNLVQEVSPTSGFLSPE